jgi:hypothetical protein
MKPTDVLILREIQEIQRRQVAQQIENTQRFDQIDEQLEEILRELEREPIETRYVSPELERAIKENARRARGIDQQVSDL